MVDLITRAQWGARSPTRPLTQVPWSEREGVAVHYTFGDRDDSPLDLQIYAQDTLGYADGHYNLLVDYLGRAYEGRGWTVSAAHSEGENFEWIGIAFIGKDGDVTPAAEATIAALCADADQLAGRKLQRAGHQELPGAQTSCPGPRLMDLVRRLREDDDMSQQASDIIVYNIRPWLESFIHTALPLLEAIAAKVDIDPAELDAIKAAAEAGAREGIAATLTPETIAAAIPDDVAEQVVHLLAARLAQ